MKSPQDKTISCSQNQWTMIGATIIVLLMTFLIHLGEFLALEGQFAQLSMTETMTNLLFIPVILSWWYTAFLANICVAMILALAQKLMEKLEKVPEKDVEIWIKDSLTLFNAFEQKISYFCLFLMSSL